jgi:Pheromone A receptor
MAIYAFYKRRRDHMQLISSANRGRYLRLMAISLIEILGTIPIGTYIIVSNAKDGVVPWKGWAAMHSHYSEVNQVAGFIWRDDPVAYLFELFRWSLVACSFIFFALFGFAGEAREHYYRLYKSLTRRIGKSTSTPRGAPLGCVLRSSGMLVCPYSFGAHVIPFFSTRSVPPYVKRNGSVTSPIMVQMGRNKGSDSISTSLTDDQSIVLDISMESALKQDSMTLQVSNSETVPYKGEPGVVHGSQVAPPPPGLRPTVRPELRLVMQ